MGFQLDNIEHKKASKSKVDTNEIPLLQREITIFQKRFSNKVKEDFYTELAVLLKAGVSLKDALELLKNTQKKKINKDILDSVVNAIISGQSLSEVIVSQKSFSEYEYYSLKIGEETGTLAEIAKQLGKFFARKNEQQRNLIGALTYPIIVLSTAFLVVLFMLNFVVPMFQDIFKQQNAQLPALTEFIISISEFVTQNSWAIFILILISVLSFYSIRKKQWFKKIKDRLILHIPYFGNLMKTAYLAQFTQAMSLLATSKVPIINAIQLVKEMIDFYPLKSALTKVEESVMKGKSLSDSLKSNSLFNDKMIAMIKVAEETNQTEFIFKRLNDQYNTQLKQQSKLLSNIMEPLIIVLIGGLVGVILIAMYLPMFELSNVIK